MKWFFNILHEYSEENRAKILQFITGTSKVPVGGFKNLKGGKFKIQAVPGGEQ